MTYVLMTMWTWNTRQRRANSIGGMSCPGPLPAFHRLLAALHTCTNCQPPPLLSIHTFPFFWPRELIQKPWPLPVCPTHLHEPDTSEWHSSGRCITYSVPVLYKKETPQQVRTSSCMQVYVVIQVTHCDALWDGASVLSGATTAAVWLRWVIKDKSSRFLHEVCQC